MIPEPPETDGNRPDRTNPKVRGLLDAAHRLFLSGPYDSVTTDAIARQAGVSKTTLYAYFSSKEVLFATLIGDHCAEISETVWTPPARIQDVEEVLRRIARNFLTIFASPDALALYRSIIAQSTRFPELGRAFYEAGPRRLQMRIADFLAEATALGHIRVPDPQIGAMQFLQLVAADAPMRGLLALEPRSPDALERTAEQGIRLFMAGYGAGPDSGAPPRQDLSGGPARRAGPRGSDDLSRSRAENTS